MSINSYNKHREGIGSSFHMVEEMNLDKVDINFDYEIFYSGRQAFKYILDEIHTNNDIEKIWMPEYYCQNAMNDWIKTSYENIYFYKTKPFDFDESININTFASKNDIVLINNYWGLCSLFEKNTNSPIIIEDHTHGWLSVNSLKSQADYCFASLRKSLPIPLGGIYWKPNNSLKINTDHFKEDFSFYDIWDTAFEAMSNKKKYKENNQEINKKDYLAAINTVELFLDQHYDLVKLRKKDQAYIKKFLNYNILKQKQKHLEFIYDALFPVDFIKVIKRKDYTAFGLILLFKDEEKCNDLKKYLIKNEIYPSVLWPNNVLSSKWKFSINIHVDFRYSIDDMHFIKNIINDWIRTY